MPTSTRGGGTERPAAPAKPPVRPDDRPGPRGPAPAPRRPPAVRRPRPDGRARPALASGPFEPPHPLLQQLGFGDVGVQAFNDKVAAIVDAHRHGLGRDPSPSLVFDVARSPVDPGDYTKLFQLP